MPITLKSRKSRKNQEVTSSAPEAEKKSFWKRNKGKIIGGIVFATLVLAGVGIIVATLGAATPLVVAGGIVVGMGFTAVGAGAFFAGSNQDNKLQKIQNVRGMSDTGIPATGTTPTNPHTNPDVTDNVPAQQARDTVTFANQLGSSEGFILDYTDEDTAEQAPKRRPSAFSPKRNMQSQEGRRFIKKEIEEQIEEIINNLKHIKNQNPNKDLSTEINGVEARFKVLKNMNKSKKRMDGLKTLLGDVKKMADNNSQVKPKRLKT